MVLVVAFAGGGVVEKHNPKHPQTFHLSVHTINLTAAPRVQPLLLPGCLNLVCIFDHEPYQFYLALVKVHGDQVANCEVCYWCGVVLYGCGGCVLVW